MSFLYLKLALYLETFFFQLKNQEELVLQGYIRDRGGGESEGENQRPGK